MPTVRVTCLLCDHPVEVRAAEVTLHLGAPEPTPRDRYGFRCPECAIFIVRRANRDIVEALVGTYEVQVATGPVPPWERTGDVLVSDAGAVRHPDDLPPAPDAPPLSHDDLHQLRRALDDEGAITAWLQTD